MPASRRPTEPEEPLRPPATTLDGRENQMIAIAVDLAERQMKEGTASAQVITHFLKLGTSRERLEQERLRKENLLLESRANALAQGGRLEELMTEAMNAFRGYSGADDGPDDFVD